MEKTIELASIRGTKINTTIVVVRGFASSNLDGDIVGNRFEEYTLVTSSFSGVSVSGEFSTSLYRGTPAGVVAQVTDVAKKVQINLDATQYAIYKSALDAMVAAEEAKPEVVEYREKCRKNAIENNDYRKFSAQVERAMTLNGKTY